MTARHVYRVRTEWTGNTGQGTAAPSAYSRAHVLMAPGKPAIEGSSDPSFRGDAGRWNPEELLLASVSACHELWYLGLCAQAGIVVVAYTDEAEGVMVEHPDGAGEFASITLCPRVVLAAGADGAAALALHEVAHEKCFIARSVNFPVACVPVVTVVASPCEATQGHARGLVCGSELLRRGSQ